MGLKKQSCIWTKLSLCFWLLPAKDRSEVRQAPLSASWGLWSQTGRAAEGFQSAHKHFGSFSKLPTSVQQWLLFLPAHETAFSEVTPQIRFFDKQRSVFCPLCNTPPSVFFSAGVYYKHLHKDVSQPGRGLLLLGCVRLLSDSQTTEQTLPEETARAFTCCKPYSLVFVNPALSLTNN